MTSRNASAQVFGTRVRVMFDGMSADRKALAHLGPWTIAVADAVPGDLADVELRERRERAIRGRLVTLVQPSSRRVPPPCPHFERCGGCQWQRLDGVAQNAAKGALVERALAASGLDAVPVDVVPAAEGWGYRTAGTYVPAADGRGPALGLHAAAGPAHVAIDACPVQSPVLQRTFAEVQRAWRILAPALDAAGGGERVCRQIRLRVGEASQEAAVGLVVDAPLAPPLRDAILDALRRHLTGLVEVTVKRARPAEPELRWGQAGVVEALLGRWYHVPVFAPFPVTGRAASAAVTCALDALELDGTATLLEMDAGIGAYTLPAAARAKRAVGRTAGEHLAVARQNAAWNEASNAIFVDRASQTLSAVIRSYGPTRRALAHVTGDPVPFGALHEAGVERLVLAATSPARLADAAGAAHAAGFRLRSVTVVDTHPQTSRADLYAAADARRGVWSGSYDGSSSATERAAPPAADAGGGVDAATERPVKSQSINTPPIETPAIAHNATGGDAVSARRPSASAPMRRVPWTST